MRNVELGLLIGMLALSGCSAERTFKKNKKFALSGEDEIATTEMQRVVVVLKDNVLDPQEVADEIAERQGSESLVVYSHAIKGFGIDLPMGQVEALNDDDRVSYFAQDLAAITSSQIVPSGITRIETEKNKTASLNVPGQHVGVNIAIIDTGISMNQADLNVVQRVNFTTDNEGDDDKNGHGTHVAGIAAARNNGDGVVGVAPGANLWSVKVLHGDGKGSLLEVIAGIDYVAANADKIDVANMSLNLLSEGGDDGDCGRTNNDPLHQAICGAVSKGVVFIVSAGNSSKDAEKTLPAAYREVITVSAMIDTDGLPGGLGEDSSRGKDDTLAPFSNFGSFVDLAAPGVDVLSTWLDGQTKVLSGTSMAAPHVTGAAGLLIAKVGKPQSLAEVLSLRDQLVASASQQDSTEGYQAAGGINAGPLLNVARFDPLNQDEDNNDDEEENEETPEESPDENEVPTPDTPSEEVPGDQPDNDHDNDDDMGSDKGPNTPGQTPSQSPTQSRT